MTSIDPEFIIAGKPAPEEQKKKKDPVPDNPPPSESFEENHSHIAARSLGSNGLLSPLIGRVIAFTAKLNTAHSTPYHSGILKLVDVLANEGDAYNPGTGVFTCPLEGLYHFTVHMSVCGRAQCAIFKNGESLASVYHTSLPNQCSQVASISSTVPLSEGDEVWVNLWGHGRHEIIATEDNDTVFVGFRLG